MGCGSAQQPWPLLIVVQILLGNVVLRNLAGMNFADSGIVGFFDAAYDPSLEGISFFQQFVDALRIRAFYPGQSLQIS